MRFVLLLLEIGAVLYYSSVQKNYMTALQEKNIDAFYHGLWMVGAVIVFISPIIALHEYTSGSFDMKLSEFSRERDCSIASERFVLAASAQAC